MVIFLVNWGYNWNDVYVFCFVYEGDFFSVGNKFEMDFINEIFVCFVY